MDTWAAGPWKSSVSGPASGIHKIRKALPEQKIVHLCIGVP